VESGAIIRDSIILTDSVIKAGAVVERAIIDKRCVIGEKAQVGKILPGEGEPPIAMIGKKSEVPAGYIVEPGAVIGTDVVASDYESNTVASDQYLQTKRLAYEV